jgi:phage portal protein BeeE
MTVGALKTDAYPGLGTVYSRIYAAQPNVRTCVDFLSRNIAQLGIHVFRRVGDTDRVRLPNHDVAEWLCDPNPSTSRYRLIESLVADLAIYYNAFWLKVREPIRRRAHASSSSFACRRKWCGSKAAFGPHLLLHAVER